MALLYCMSEPMYSSATAYRYERREMNEGVMCVSGCRGHSKGNCDTLRGPEFNTTHSIQAKFSFVLSCDVLA